MFVLIAYNKGSCKDPITVGVPTLELIINEIAQIEYINLKSNTKLSYILYNGFSVIIDALGNTTEQGEYIRFKGQEQAKARSRAELIQKLEESKSCTTQNTVDAEETVPVVTKAKRKKRT